MRELTAPLFIMIFRQKAVRSRIPIRPYKKLKAILTTSPN